MGASRGDEADGVDGYLIKPVSLSKLEEEVTRLLAV